MQPFKRVRMIDVARKAGVAKPTVSIVLAGRRDIQIPEKTRARILRVARRMNYRLDGTARNLALGRTSAVAFVFDAPAGFLLDDPFNREVFSGVVGSSLSENLSLLFSPYDPAAKVIPSVERRLVDGVLYLAAKQAKAIPYFEKSGLPFVLLNPDVGYPPGISAVAWDDSAAGRLAARQVAQKGHQRALFLLPGWKGEVMPSYHARAEGFRAAFPSTELLTLPLDGAVGESYRLGCAAASGLGRATAVVAANDQIAWGLMDTLRQRGVRVPEDVSLVGFDGLPRGFAPAGPSLASVSFDRAEMGRAGLRLLRRILEGGKPGLLRLPPHWREGGSLRSLA